VQIRIPEDNNQLVCQFHKMVFKQITQAATRRQGLLAALVIPNEEVLQDKCCPAAELPFIFYLLPPFKSTGSAFMKAPNKKCPRLLAGAAFIL
jgi:hypothetical protein